MIKGIIPEEPVSILDRTLITTSATKKTQEQQQEGLALC